MEDILLLSHVKEQATRAMYNSGKTRFPKEQRHNGGYSFSPTVPATTSIEDRWVGIKYVVYNFVQDGKTIVKLENWLDNNNNGWAKIYEYTDAGGWGNQEHNVEEILTR